MDRVAAEAFVDVAIRRELIERVCGFLLRDGNDAATLRDWCDRELEELRHDLAALPPSDLRTAYTALEGCLGLCRMWAGALADRLPRMAALLVDEAWHSGLKTKLVDELAGEETHNPKTPLAS